MPPSKLEEEMLAHYLDRMCRRRQEINSTLLHPQPQRGTVPDYLTYKTKVVEDEESKQVGVVLEAFFNQPSPPSLPSLTASKLNPEALPFEPPKKKEQTVFFADLPKPLRKRIWKMSLPGSRLVKLQRTSDNTGIYSKSPVPTLLHINQESRTVALNYYTLSFPGNDRAARTYFDFRIDGIYSRCRGCIGENCGHKWTWTEDHKKVGGVVFVSPLSFSPFLKIHKLFPNLQSLILMSGIATTSRSQVFVEDMQPFPVPFAWQTGSLRDNFYETLANKGKIVEGKLKQAKRMTMNGMVQVATQATSDLGGICCL